MKFDIHPTKTALLLIDMTNAFLKPERPLEIAKGRDLVPKLNVLLSACREKDILVIFTTHVHRAGGRDIGLFGDFYPVVGAKCIPMEGTPDVEIYDGLDRRSSDIVISKQAYSAFLGTELDLILRINGIDTLIMGGLATHGCCESTARDARHRNYKVIFLSDGTATRDFPDMGWGALSANEIQNFVLTVMAASYAEVSSIEEVLRRLSQS